MHRLIEFLKPYTVIVGFRRARAWNLDHARRIVADSAENRAVFVFSRSGTFVCAFKRSEGHENGTFSAESALLWVGK